MLKKNESAEKIIINSELYEINNSIKVSPYFIIYYNNYIYNKEQQEHKDFENNKIQYINKKNELSLKKEYDINITNLYTNGKIIINNITNYINDYYIIYNDNEKNYNLININDNIKKDIKYNKAIKFKDSTAFIELINNGIINDDNAIIINQEILNNIINKWDEKIHNKTIETDAIINKNILKENDDE